MRIESSVTSISWIPQEAVEGLTKLPFGMGVAHYDLPPPDHIDDLDDLASHDRFRFANRLSAWIDVDNGQITSHGYSGGGRIGSTTMRLAGRDVIFAAIALPDRQLTPVIGDAWVRFVQTAGGRTGLPMPRRVRRPPFVQVAAPLAWTTLTLTLFADGTSTYELSGASAFPRHWVFDAEGNLALKSGLVSFKQWYRSAFGRHTPWGDEDSPALVSTIESALERELSVHIMTPDAQPHFRMLDEGRTLVEQGDVGGGDIHLLLDGLLSVEIDGTAVTQLGPGAIVGEGALVTGEPRNATLRAITRCRVASVRGDAVSIDRLAELAARRSSGS
jgi:cyclic nucleotide-binding protein